MADSIFKRMGKDLLQLEIKTILKSDSPEGLKMPNEFREAFFRLAKGYRDYVSLIEKKITEKGNEPAWTWTYGGVNSFRELSRRAYACVDKINDWLDSEESEKGREGSTREPGEAGDSRLMNVRRILIRIRVYSEHMIAIFNELEANITKGGREEDGYRPIPPDAPRDTGTADGDEPAKPHVESLKWNNDVSLEKIRKEDDLPLDHQQELCLRKAWNLGTEEVVMHTTIEIDGDVTTRIMRDFAEKPNKKVLEIHNDAIKTAVQMWKTVVETAASMAGVAVEKLMKS